MNHEPQLPKRGQSPESAPEKPTLTYFEWVNGILEEREHTLPNPRRPRRAQDKSAA